ncbi:MAG: NADH-quinone oxidoreductase subunit H [Lentisphaeria bacterium]|nr:NADH-quinone oxidoreductase subunit H [Lentisphaeria bacterium]
MMNDIQQFFLSHLHPIINSLIALVLAPVIGGLLMGLDRKLTARMQGRMGPPLLQPFYDIFKLFSKESMVVHRPQVIYAVCHLLFMMLTLVMLVTGQDLLLTLLVHTFAAISLVLGGMSVRSPYSWIGSQRKILQILAYEPVLILLVLGVRLLNGSFWGINVLQSDTPLIQSMPLLFLALISVIAVEMGKSPFDTASSHHAHQEIVRGINLEYAGPYLALTEISHLYETAIAFGLVLAFWHTCLIGGLVLAVLVFFCLALVDNCFARLTPAWLVRYMWLVPLALALANLICLWR